MNIDLRTLALIMTITNVLQFLALLIQYFINRSYKGLGWWTLASAAWGLAFVLLNLRDAPGIGTLAVILNNFLFILGLLWLYNGLMSFFGRRKNRDWQIAFMTADLILISYFTLAANSLTARLTILGVAGAFVFSLLAHTLLNNRLHSVQVPAYVLTGMFLIDAIFFLFFAFGTLANQPNNLFAADTLTTASYLMTLVTSTTWTLCFILMVNQRLSNESREAQESIENIFRASPDAIVVSTLKEGRIIRTNEAFSSLTGYSQAEALGKSSSELGISKHPAERERLTGQLQESEATQNQEAILQRKDGSLLTTLISARVVELQDVPHIISITHDISERKDMEEALLAAQVELEERVRERTADLQTANKGLEKALSARDEFLAAMSHELRTPLAGVLGLAQVLQLQTYGPLTEKQTRALKNIENSGQQLLRLINDILDYSKIQSSNLPLGKQHCMLGVVCQAALAEISAQVEHKLQQTNLQISPPDLSLKADNARLRQILKHLLSNASKFTPEGGRIGIEAGRQGAEIHITVWDTGIGISAEDRSHLFKPFVQLDARLARMYNGTGLGLALVKGLVDLHNGRIELESTPGQGSRFTVIFPAE